MKLSTCCLVNRLGALQWLLLWTLFPWARTSVPTLGPLVGEPWTTCRPSWNRVTGLPWTRSPGRPGPQPGSSWFRTPTFSCGSPPDPSHRRSGFESPESKSKKDFVLLRKCFFLIVIFWSFPNYVQICSRQRKLCNKVKRVLKFLLTHILWKWVESTPESIWQSLRRRFLCPKCILESKRSNQTLIRKPLCIS